MSLEVKIEALTASVNQLIAVMSSAQQSAPAAPVVQTPLVSAPTVPVSVTPTNHVQSQPMAPAMPALPTFAPAPAPVPTAPAAPFSTPQAVMEYTMGAYKAMGPEKGNKIQGILQGMGVANLNDLKPEQYGPFYQAVEALKVS
jgi:hypothetical protein